MRSLHLRLLIGADSTQKGGVCGAQVTGREEGHPTLRNVNRQPWGEQEFPLCNPASPLHYRIEEGIAMVRQPEATEYYRVDNSKRLKLTNRSKDCRTQEVQNFSWFNQGKPPREIQSREILFLSQILSSSNSRRKAVLIAETLINTFGSLLRVLTAESDDISAAPGVGRANATAIEFSRSIILDVASSSMRLKPKFHQAALINIIIWSIGESIIEKVMLIYLNKSGGFIGHEIVSTGSESSAGASPKSILSAACRRGASAVVIAHNHPGGSVEPSDDDLILTRKISHAASALDIKIADHVIVSGCQHFSFKEIGYL